MGASNENHDHAKRYQDLMTRICQLGIHTNPDRLLQIKTHIGKQNLQLIENTALLALAENILTAKNTLEALTYDGAWLLRLIGEPRFVGACPPDLFCQLLERFRAISLTLKQDEYEKLKQFLSIKSPYLSQYKAPLNQLYSEIDADPQRKNYLQTKLDRLLRFRAQDTVRAMINELETNCLALGKTEKTLADAALNTLYSYLAKQIKTLRADILFRMGDAVYSWAQQGKGDLAIATNTMLGWMKRHLPHKTFEAEELCAKSTPDLYDANGNRVGFVDENLYCMMFVKNELVSMLEQGAFPVGEVFYNINKQRLGTLTQQGCLKYENIFQRETAAHLLNQIPLAELNQSPRARDLLLDEILRENTFDLLDSREKRELLTPHLQETSHFICADFFSAWIECTDINSIIDILGNSKVSKNAVALFEALLLNKEKRDLFLSAPLSPRFEKFLDQNDAKNTFALFLQKHYHQPWFTRAFNLFAQYANKKEKHDLLSEALLILEENALAGHLNSQTYDSIRGSLFSSAKVAAHILYDFLKVKSAGPIQRAGNTHSALFCPFINKREIISALNRLNNGTNLESHGLYRLVLLVLHNEYDRLFPKLDLRLSEKTNWRSNELKELSQFVTSRLGGTNDHDSENHLYEKLMADLVFRSANVGQTDLFYLKDGSLNKALFSIRLQPKVLPTLAKRLYQSTVKKMKQPFKSTQEKEREKTHAETLSFLKKNSVVVEWDKVTQETLDKIDQGESPLITAFVLNYVGPSQPLITLLTKIIKHPDYSQVTRTLSALSSLMAKHNSLEVSAVIFKTLANAANNKPTVLNAAIFQDMANFYTLNHTPNTQKMTNTEKARSLITHFGQQKQYRLVQHCAGLTINQNGKSREMTRAIKEAKIEARLLKSIHRWYFWILKYLVRWWNYGFSSQKSVKIVKRCEDTSTYSNPEKEITSITTDLLGGKRLEKEVETAQKAKNLHERVQQFVNKDTKNPCFFEQSVPAAKEPAPAQRPAATSTSSTPNPAPYRNG